MAVTNKPNPFDPQAMLEVQRRNFDAFRNAGQIVADGMRTYAERQIAMMQEAMRGLWTEMQSTARRPAAAAEPTEQLERMRAAFERVMDQVQELSNLLLKVQSEAIQVLNECAAKNLESLGQSAPEFTELQTRAKEAFEAASKQTTAVVDEMKKRMATLEEETRQVASKPPVPAPPPTDVQPPKPQEPKTEAPPPAGPASTRARRATKTSAAGKTSSAGKASSNKTSSDKTSSKTSKK